MSLNPYLGINRRTVLVGLSMCLWSRSWLTFSTPLIKNFIRTKLKFCFTKFPNVTHASMNTTVTCSSLTIIAIWWELWCCCHQSSCCCWCVCCSDCRYGCRGCEIFAFVRVARTSCFAIRLKFQINPVSFNFLVITFYLLPTSHGQSSFLALNSSTQSASHNWSSLQLYTQYARLWPFMLKQSFQFSFWVTSWENMRWTNRNETLKMKFFFILPSIRKSDCHILDTQHSNPLHMDILKQV